MPHFIRLAILGLPLLAAPAMARTLPLPPVPPPFPAPMLPTNASLGTYQQAPTPDPNAFAPNPPARTFEASPTVFNLRDIYRGDGYPYGASPQGYADRSSTRIPGVTLKVQLQ